MIEERNDEFSVDLKGRGGEGRWEELPMLGDCRVLK